MIANGAKRRTAAGPNADLHLGVPAVGRYEWAMMIREENPSDIPEIRALVTIAFKDVSRSNGTEGALVDALREQGALTISLIAELEGMIVGHVAFSSVEIQGEAVDWYGLGPVAVRPDRQRRGIGRALIEAGIERIKELGARGCVVLGDPAYYSRFKFKNEPALYFSDVPSKNFQCLNFGDQGRQGLVVYHSAFYGL